ncbi:hypothetical protein ASG39_22360 [Rhizobium sp. Leaf371]|nr:hypothetical protein ASG39_22360 [Rhizobium sp. Leaf371]
MTLVTHAAIEALGDDVHEPVIDDELDRNIRTRLGEGRQPRKHDVDGCHAVGVDPNAPRRPGASGVERPQRPFDRGHRGSKLPE